MIMLKFFRRLFCKHEWEKEIINGGFLVVDGWFVRPARYRCRKCGKTITEAEKALEAKKDG